MRNMTLMLSALLLLLPSKALAAPADAAAGLAFPYFTSTIFAAPNTTVITITNVSNLQIAVRVVAISGDPGPSAFHSVDFACPLVPLQTTAVVFRRNGATPVVEAECSEIGATPMSPSTALSEMISRDLAGANGMAWFAVEDPLTGITQGLDALHGSADVLQFAAGQMYTIPPYVFKSIGPNNGDRVYRFGVEYTAMPGNVSAPFLFDDFSATAASGTRMILGTLDGTTGAGAPAVQLNVDYYDQFESGFDANFSYSPFALVRVEDISPNLLKIFQPGSAVGKMLAAASFFPASALAIHDAIPGVGDNDGVRRAPPLAWLIEDYFSTGVPLGPYSGPPPAGPPNTPGSGQAARMLSPGPGAFVPSGTDTAALNVPLLDSDGDGIEDPVDLAPIFSNDFSDVPLMGMTSGVILIRGDQLLGISDGAAPFGVRVEADSGGGPTAAQAQVCPGPSTLTVNVPAGAGFLLTCTSAEVLVYDGSISGSFQIAGQPGSFELVANGATSGFTLDGETMTISADENNAHPIVVVVNGMPLTLDPGESVTDTDGDGTPDEADACVVSDVQETVVIDGCHSGVENFLLQTGCSINDEIDACAASARNHGAFVRCVSHLTNGLKKRRLITGKEKGAIQRCAAKADLP